MNALAHAVYAELRPRFNAHLLGMDISVPVKAVHRWHYEHALDRLQAIAMDGPRAPATLAAALTNLLRENGHVFVTGCTVDSMPFRVEIEVRFPPSHGCLAHRSAMAEELLSVIILAMSDGVAAMRRRTDTCRVVFANIQAVAIALPAPAHLPPTMLRAIEWAVSSLLPHYRLRCIDEASLVFGLQAAADIV